MMTLAQSLAPFSYLSWREAVSKGLINRIVGIGNNVSKFMLSTMAELQARRSHIFL